MARAAKFLLLLGILFVGSRAGDGPAENKSKISMFDIKVDLCYHWKTGSWPPWILQKQIPLRQKYEKKYFYRYGHLMSNVDIWEFCQKYKYVILDPFFNNAHYEFCWYAKYGAWKSNPKNQEEEAERNEMLAKYLYKGERRISQQEVQRLCPNYNAMNCQPCSQLKHEMCHYARYGKWKKKAPSIRDIRRFFYLGRKRIDASEILLKCSYIFDNTCKKVYYPRTQYY